MLKRIYNVLKGHKNMPLALIGNSVTAQMVLFMKST